MNHLNHQCDPSCDDAAPERLSDQAWLTQVFRENELAMMGYATHLLGDRDRASDVVHDTFVRLCKQPRRQVEDRVRQWLFRVCRNRALDILKKESRMKTLDDANASRQISRDSDPVSIAVMTERYENAQGLLATLPPRQQEVIRLKIHGDLSYREISELTGLSVGNVGYLLSTGLKMIRNQLATAE